MRVLVIPLQELLNLELSRLPRRMKSFAAFVGSRIQDLAYKARSCLGRVQISVFLDGRPLDLAERTILPLARM
jgi:hypothetical protein